MSIILDLSLIESIELKCIIQSYIIGKENSKDKTVCLDLAASYQEDIDKAKGLLSKLEGSFHEKN